MPTHVLLSLKFSFARDVAMKLSFADLCQQIFCKCWQSEPTADYLPTNRV